MTGTTLDVVSIGRLACDVQASIPRVRQALAQLDIPATIRINGIDHFDATVADSLFPLLNQQTPEFIRPQ